MLVLDTNVISELLNPEPSEAVARWVEEQPLVFTTSITLSELLFGAESMPAGARQRRLRRAIENIFARSFVGRVLPFDEDAARVFGVLVAHRKAIGRPIRPFDAAIASICRARSAAVATRDVRGFEHCGIEVINPWEA